MHYMVSGSQGPYKYHVKLGEGIEAKDLGVVVNVNLSFVKTWFVGEERKVSLQVSAEKFDGDVQNFSWRIFWVELFTVKEGRWKDIVAHGSSFLNEGEWSDTYLYKRQNVSVDVVNLNYLESAYNALFRIGIMMDIYHNNTEYSLTFYTPIGEIGSVAVLSPFYSPTSLGTISAVTTALLATLTRQLRDKVTLTYRRKPSL